MVNDFDKLTRGHALFLKVRTIVEGLYAGVHKSALSGYSIEFQDHRAYEKGDDLRFVDWKLYAKTDRFYVKKFVRETNADAHIFLDASNSMAYRDKFEFAKLIAGSILYAFSRQKDRVSVYMAGNKTFYMPLSMSITNMHRMFKIIDEKHAHGKFSPDEAFKDFVYRIKKRGIAVIISDFFYPADIPLKVVKFLSAKHNDVVVFHVYSQFERNLTERGIYIDMETNDAVDFDAVLSAESYKKRFDSHLRRIKSSCVESNVQYVESRIESGIENVLLKFIEGRV